ncbi:MAG TPA: glycosyltransferase family 39 protein, partial [Thermoanaerobaculia bacterium]|nr:glycosyltransferase family 39 protein [Thermoanaerobaculia bacterium]
MPRAPRLLTPLAVGALLVALFLLEALSVRDKTLTYDAPEHLRYGRQILHGDATRFDDSKMPVSAWNALPGRIAEELEPGPLRRFLAADGTARYPTMLASVLLAWLVFRWSRELYGVAAGFLSLVLHVLDPNLLAHSRLVTTDLYAALTITLSLYTFWRFLRACEKLSSPTAGAPASPLAASRLLDVGPATPASPRLARG